MKVIFRITISMVMDEVFHQMEIAMKASLIIMICMDMEFILTWNHRNDMKEFGNEVRSKEYFESTIEQEGFLNV